MGIENGLCMDCTHLDRPLMASAIPQHFKLEENLQRGMLPLAQHAKNAIEDLKAYIARYIQQTIQMNALLRKMDHFYRFLEVISLWQSCVLNCNAIARECGLSNKTVENHVHLLEAQGLSFRLPIFDKNPKRLLSRHEKFYFFDVGVYQAIKPSDTFFGMQPLSTLVAQHLRAWLDNSEKEGKLYCWRTKLGQEVDFVIDGAIGFYAIALKESNTLNAQDFKGLELFKKDYPESFALMIYGGTTQIKIHNVLCVPLHDFLLNLKPNKPLLRLTTSRATLATLERWDPKDA